MSIDHGCSQITVSTVEEPFVKEDQRIHRLILGGRSDVCVYGEVGQERFGSGFGRKEILTGLHVVKTNKPYDPDYIGPFRVNRIVVQTEYLSDLIEESGILFVCQVRHYDVPVVIP